MSVSKSLRDLQRHPLILPLYLPATINAFSDGVLTLVLPLYARDFKVSYGLIGLVMAGEALGMLVGDVPAGILMRRMGQKGSMLLGLAGIVLSTVALVWAQSIPEVVVYRLITGFGRSLYTVSRHAYAAGTVRVGIRGRAIALLGGIMRIGRFVGPLVAGIIAAKYGLRASFLLIGGVSGLALLVVALFVHPMEKPTHQSSTESKAQGSHLLSVLRAQYRLLASAGVGQLFAQMIRTGRRIIIPLYAADVIGLDIEAIGFVVSLSSAVDMMLFYPAGWIMDQLGRKRAIVPSFLIQAAGIALVPLTGSFLSLLAVASLMAIGNGLGSGSMMTLGADLAPEQSRGEFLGVWRWIGDVGMTGGPLIVGAVADLVVLPTAALAMAAAGLAAGVIFAFLVPETLNRPASVT